MPIQYMSHVMKIYCKCFLKISKLLLLTNWHNKKFDGINAIYKK